MYYNYNIKGEIIRVWRWDDDFHKEVTVMASNRNYDRTIRQDEVGNKFFTWNKDIVYLTDYIKITLNELKEKIENNEHVTSDDLTQAILNEGLDNVRFICPLHPITIAVPQLGFSLCDASKYIDTLCKVSEERYKVSKNYKIGVISVDEKNVRATSFYTSDMLSLIQSGRIQMLIGEEGCSVC